MDNTRAHNDTIKTNQNASEKVDSSTSSNSMAESQKNDKEILTRKGSDAVSVSTGSGSMKKVPEKVVAVIEETESIMSHIVKISETQSIDGPGSAHSSNQVQSSISYLESSLSSPNQASDAPSISQKSMSSSSKSNKSRIEENEDTISRSASSKSSDFDQESVSHLQTSNPDKQYIKGGTPTAPIHSSVSTSKPASLNLNAFEGSPEMLQLATFYNALDTKYYYSGYVYKLNTLSVDGTPMFKNAPPQVIAENDGVWSKWWMEVVGPTLYLWRVPDELASFGYTASLPFEQMIKNELDPPIEVMNAIKCFQEVPLIIHFADSVAEVFPIDYNFSSTTGNPAPPIPYNCFFSLTSLSSNLFMFASASIIQLNNWVCSIRLAIFELQRLNQLFTQRLLHQSDRLPIWNQFGLQPFTSSEYRGEVLYEGSLQIRLPYSSIWKQVYAVVTSKSGQEAFLTARTASKLFHKKEVQKDGNPSKRGSILIYESKKAAQKGKSPLITLTDVRSVYAIWPSETQIENVSLAKIECAYTLTDPPLNNFSGERTFSKFESGFSQIRKIDDIEALISGADSRPEPSDLLILTSNTLSLTKWIVGILSAFSLESESRLLEEEAIAMSAMKETFNERSKWPSILYLSLDEVGGVSMPRYSMEESQILFSHYLLQKIMCDKNDKLSGWNQHISKGEWERGLCDRKEMEFKLTFLFHWVEKLVLNLKEINITVSKPHPTILVSAMANVIEWLGPVLTSMVGNPESITPMSEIESLTSESLGGSNQSKLDSSVISESSDGDGSVSEEERSDEGSQSEDEDAGNEYDMGSSSHDESFKAISKTSDSKSLSLNTHDTKSEESNSPDSDEFEFYGPNSLLSMVNPSKLPLKGQGPFFDTTGEVLHRQSMITGIQNQKRDVTGGPLLGVVKDPSHKAKLQTGLLGEIERREEETKQLGLRTSIVLSNRLSMGTSSIPDTILVQLNGITQKMIECLDNPEPTTLDIMREDILQMQAIISQELLKKRTNGIANSSYNHHPMSSITWAKSNSSKNSNSEKDSVFQNNLSNSTTSSSETSSSTSDGSSKDESESNSETSSGSLIDNLAEEEIPLGDISKRLSAIPPNSVKTSARELPIDFPRSQDSSQVSDRLLSAQSRRPETSRPLLQNQFPSKMYEVKSRPIASIPDETNAHNIVLRPKNNRKEIRSAPIISKSSKNYGTSSPQSSEGSISDDSD